MTNIYDTINKFLKIIFYLLEKLIHLIPKRQKEYGNFSEIATYHSLMNITDLTEYKALLGSKKEESLYTFLRQRRQNNEKV